MDVIKNNPQVKKDIYLANVFNFEDFLSNSSIADTITMSVDGTTQSNYPVVDRMIKSIVNFYSKKSVDDVMSMFQGLLIDTDFDVKFVPYIQESYKSNVKPEIIKMEVYKLVQNINVANMDKLSSEILDMPEDMFSFGEKLFTFSKDYNVNQFKLDMSGAIPKSFYPLLYYKHLIYRSSACAGDVECQRVYNLAQYIFVYYVIMLLFLFVFDSNERVNRFATETKSSMESLQKLKYDLVAIADAILMRLEEKNMLDISLDGLSGKMSANAVDKEIKQVATTNQQISQQLIFKKTDLDNLQINLSSYNNMQSVSYMDKRSCTFWFWVIVAICVFILIGIIGQTATGGYFAADILSLGFAAWMIVMLTGWSEIIYRWLLNIFVE